MPALPKFRHEALAQAMAKGEDKTLAYMKIWGTKIKQSAAVNVSKLLNNAKHGPPLLERIEELRKPIIEKAVRQIEVSQERIIEEMAKLAFSDMRGAAAWDDKGVKFRSSEEIDDATAAAIQEVSVGPDGRPKLKLASKTSALKDLGSFLGMSQPEMAVMVLNKIMGVSADAGRVTDPRETARRAALLLRQGRALANGN